MNTSDSGTASHRLTLSSYWRASALGVGSRVLVTLFGCAADRDRAGRLRRVRHGPLRGPNVAAGCALRSRPAGRSCPTNSGIELRVASEGNEIVLADADGVRYRASLNHEGRLVLTAARGASLAVGLPSVTASGRGPPGTRAPATMEGPARARRPPGGRRARDASAVRRAALRPHRLRLCRYRLWHRRPTIGELHRPAQ